MKKYAPYILILFIFIFIGLFSPTVRVQAEECKGQSADGTLFPSGCTPIVETKTTTTTTTSTQSAFKDEIDENTCGFGSWFGGGSVTGCVIQLFYIIFYQIPSLILYVSAYFFNVLISITLSSAMLSNSFVSEAWGIVRDISNIFFILILLFIAIKIILDMGASEAKKMISKVIIIALLINFSMFFTQIIIDSSNILALIFYNKVSVNTKNADGKERPYQSTGSGEKDVAGGLVNAFDPTKLVSKEYLENAKKNEPINGVPVADSGKVPPGILIGMIFIAGILMLFAAYCLFVVGFSFLGRLIELFVLIIFSPFAFMSSTVKNLSSIDYIGWDHWFKRLIKVAFMAPIFMFFLYFIFMLIHADLFKGLKSASADRMIESLLMIVLPALLVLVLLLKATKFAKEGSGAIGDAVMKGAKIAGGLALGGAALGTAFAGRRTVGAVAKSVQNDTARKNDLTFKDTRNKWNTMNKLNPFAYAGLAGTAVAGLGKATTAGVATGIHAIPSVGGKTIGQQMQAQDKGFQEKAHATHLLDAKMQQEFGNTYGKDAKYKDLKESEQAVVKKEIDKDEIAKFQFGKLFKDLGTKEAGDIMHDYDNGRRILEDKKTGTKTDANVTLNPRTGDVLTAVDRKTGIAMTTPSDQKVRSDVIVGHSKANVAIGEFVQALRKGSYDIRGLPDMKAKSKGFPKLGVAVIAGVAAGVRMGIKKGGGVEYGTPQRDVLKDIGNTISESLKNAKFNIGGGKGGGDHTPEVKSVGH